MAELPTKALEQTSGFGVSPMLDGVLPPLTTTTSPIRRIINHGFASTGALAVKWLGPSSYAVGCHPVPGNSVATPPLRDDG